MAGARTPAELERWKPGSGDWGPAEAAHLLRRAGFGGDRAALERAVRQGLDAAVDELLAFDAEDDRTLRADLLPGLEMADIDTLAGWCLYRMRFGRSPLREKLALFWHGRFATSNDKVQNVPAMAGQLFLLLDHAAGSFAELLHAVVRDPAMLQWLDAAGSDRDHPNENLARELFELFALGRGAYGERDVLEAARALTGATLEHGRYRFDPERHDAGDKTVLGRRGRLDADEVVDACLEHPACGRHLARGLLEFFVEPEPGEAAIELLADGLRKNGYRVGWALDVVLRSRLFHAPRVRQALVKSPVELVVGLLQALGATGNFKELAGAAGRMGQSLLRPPSVRGWIGGLAWIDAATLLERHSFAARLLRGQFGPAPRLGPEQDLDADLRALGLDDLDAAVRTALERTPADLRIQALAALPEYQLA
jgi:uncharacterized protein (DUF1800 family)